jgi:hypothetical protein
MLYKNIKTGYIIDVNSEVKGTLWEPLKAPVKPAPAEVETEKAEENKLKIKDEPEKITSKRKVTPKKAVKKK